uniref:P-type domain-containing protein n=1 Tax=Ciona savignyi TaxID=51511 RepID=H2YX77_CIOSA
MIYERLARTYGVDSMAVQLMMSNRKDAAARHLAARMTPTSNANPLNSLILRAVTSGQGLTRTNVMDYYIDQTYRSHSRLAREAQKAIVRGDLRTAVSFMLLDANRGRRTFNESYERNEALFAFMVDNQKSHPGRINPGIIMSLAQDQKINALPDKDFMELFGVSAFDYVCAAHQPSLRLPCSKLRGNTYHSSLDCINAGCCLAQASFPDERPICYDNLLGGVGVGLVKHIWDEDFIIRTVFNNQLPTLESFYPDGIPWIPSRDVPASLSNAGALDPNQPNWFGSLNVNGVMLHPRPTGLPIGPNKFRPNFVWTPHGPTPFPTLMPQDGSRVVPAVTSSPGVVGGPYVPPAGSSPIVMGLNLNNMASCRGVQRNDRYECMPNLQSMVPGGEAACGRLDCCFDPVWNDMSVPACFRKANY